MTLFDCDIGCIWCAEEKFIVFPFSIEILCSCSYGCIKHISELKVKLTFIKLDTVGFFHAVYKSNLATVT